MTAGQRRLRYEDVAADVLESSPRLGHVRLVTVDGPSGSGKTSLAKRLAHALHRVPVVHLDHLYEGWEGLESVGPRLEAWLLTPLRSGLPGRHLVYDWHRGRFAEWRDVPMAPALIVEGVGAGQLLVDPWVTMRVWVETDADVSTQRALAREGEANREHLARWVAVEREHFAREQTRERADLVVDSAVDTDVDRDSELVATRYTLG